MVDQKAKLKNNMLILHAATFPCLYQNNVLPCMDSLLQHN